MLTRKQFNWNVKLQSDAGETIDFPITNYWSPTKEGAETAIAVTAKAMAYYQSGMTHKYAVLGTYQVK